MDSERAILWIAFNIFVLGMLALDLGVFHRKAHAVSIKEAGMWSVIWISLAMVFNAGIYFLWGQEPALQFLTGYVIEKSLSVDNLFVFLMIFQYFATPAEYQHRVLFWGIIGALLLRALFIATGAALLQNFHWMIYVFGGFLVFSGIKMALQGDEEVEPDKNPVVKLFKRLIPVTPEYHGQQFFVMKDGKRYATLLMLVLVVVETTDVIFAVDSIPAIFAITQDPFIVYTSNVFAILGLRALYFLLAGVMGMFKYLKVGLSFVLCFVGAKMIAVDVYKIPIGASLAVIGGALALSVIASIISQKREQAALIRGEFVGPPPAVKYSPIFANAPRFASVVLAVFIIGSVLTLVKWHSIAQGPTGHEAIVVLRLVEREMAHAENQFGKTRKETIAEAQKILDAAWDHFENSEYESAILTAKKAEQSILPMIRP